MNEKNLLIYSLYSSKRSNPVSTLGWDCSFFPFSQQKHRMPHKKNKIPPNVFGNIIAVISLYGGFVIILLDGAYNFCWFPFFSMSKSTKFRNQWKIQWKLALIHDYFLFALISRHLICQTWTFKCCSYWTLTNKKWAFSNCLTKRNMPDEVWLHNM